MIDMDLYLRERIKAILREPTGSDDTKIQRRVRWLKAAETAVKHWTGDIVEIGALAGDTTVLLCPLAEVYLRKVLVIDPWLAPTHDVAGWEHDAFMERTRTWRENGVLEVIEDKSQKPEHIRRLANERWAFALVDGSHEHNDAFCDMMAVRHAKVIAIDDMDKPGIRLAFDKALAMMPERDGIFDENVAWKWEGYIV